MGKINLGVNIDHIATLRQVRGRTTIYPDLLEATRLIKKSGGHQITIHLREDRRHIQDEDLATLAKKCPLPLNLELALDSQVFALALRAKPEWCCFVPEKREELTTEGGLDLIKNESILMKYIQKIRKTKSRSGKTMRVSCFIEPHAAQIQMAAKLGADAVEFHTGEWCLKQGLPEEKKLWKLLVAGAQLAQQLNLRVHAGHGLDFKTTKKIIKLKYLKEVNIGHSIICYSVYTGIRPVIKKLNGILGN